jgi:hypothetical protein
LSSEWSLRNEESRNAGSFSYLLAQLRKGAKAPEVSASSNASAATEKSEKAERAFREAGEGPQGNLINRRTTTMESLLMSAVHQ